MAVRYKDAILDSLAELGLNPHVVFIGYNTACGSKGGGSFNRIPQDKLIETPLAENLMMGAAVGMALVGKIPVVYFERADFLTNALDSIVNHLDKLMVISQGVHSPACIIRVVVGNSKVPLFTGPTHTQDFSEAIRRMVSFPVHQLTDASSIKSKYKHALEIAYNGTSTMLVEYKDLY